MIGRPDGGMVWCGFGCRPDDQIIWLTRWPGRRLAGWPGRRLVGGPPGRLIAWLADLERRDLMDDDEKDYPDRGAHKCIKNKIFQCISLAD